MFSQYAVGNAKGPRKKHMAILERYVEKHGHICGDAVRVYSNGETETLKTEEGEDEEKPLLFCKEGHVCWNTVESQYCAAADTSTKGGRLQTKTVCCHCYSGGKLADEKYLEKKRGNMGGKKCLPICEACVDDGADLQTKKGGKTSKLQQARDVRKRKAAQRKETLGKRSKKSL